MFNKVLYYFLVIFLFYSFILKAQVIIDPEGDTGWKDKKLVKASNYMVSSASLDSSQIASEVLKKGGNAIDAAVITQLVLGLVEPQSSGLGGGAFVVFYNAQTKKTITIDGRETAPLNATSDMFLDENKNPIKFMDAVVGGKSVATPATVMLLWQMHSKYGKLPWNEIIEPVIKLAENGFIISDRLAELVVQFEAELKVHKTTREYFFHKDGTPIYAGELKTNQNYANTLRAISKNVDSFYKGKIAKDIIKTVTTTEKNKGILQLKDLENYNAIEREPLCFSYKIYEICGMNPPGVGTVSIGQILGILEYYPVNKLKDKTEFWRLFGESMRISFADSDLYIADDRFISVPIKQLLDKQYLKNRAEYIKSGVKDKIDPLEISSNSQGEVLYTTGFTHELPSTTHFSIVDSTGNIVSMTSTIENGFGSNIMVGGFLLNNEMTDFSFVAERDDKLVANRIEPNKKPKSSMTPLIVFDDKKQPILIVGSPGGGRIIGYVAKTIIGVLEWDLDVQRAININNMININGIYEVDSSGSFDTKTLIKELENIGYEVDKKKLNSGIHAIQIKYNKNGKILEGAADPRREGVVVGG